MEAADGDSKLPMTGTVAPTPIRTALIPGLFQFLRIGTKPKSAVGLSMQLRPAQVGNWRMEACAAPNLSRRFAQKVGLIWTWMKVLELAVREAVIARNLLSGWRPLKKPVAGPVCVGGVVVHRDR
jgi:hypothetical protein